MTYTILVVIVFVGTWAAFCCAIISSTIGPKEYADVRNWVVGSTLGLALYGALPPARIVEFFRWLT